MTFEEILALVEADHEVRFPREEVEKLGDNLVVSGLVPLRLASVNSSLGVANGDIVADIEVVTETGNRLGFLCLCTQLGEINLNEITDAQYAAYLVEVPKDLFGYPYRFSYDYFVAESGKIGEYFARYRSTASLWGGFLHDQTDEGLPQVFHHLPTQIVGVPDLTFPTPFHAESCRRSVAEPYAFERFLKLYHLFELLFDWDLVKRIQGLGDDLLGVGKLLNEYDRNELERLKDVMQERCGGIAQIEAALNQIAFSEAGLRIGRTMFFTYGKGGNTFTGINAESLFEALFDAGGFSHVNAQSVKIPNTKERKAYEVFLVRTAAYWVYRIRCSIAHARIGEYVITTDDEEFIVRFAEPLLRELLSQALRAVA